MNLPRSVLLAAALAHAGFPASLAVSTYLKDGFTPAAIASDAQGNIYLAGSVVIDPASQTTGAAVAKIDSKASQYLYLSYFDSAVSDQVAAMAIDPAGNVYIAGSTTNPNFPTVGGGALGTAPTGPTDSRTFAAKLNPQGFVVLSVLLGGSVTSTAQGIAITPQGQILVSGIAGAKGFPTTAGAYTAADSTQQWFLMELDAAAGRMIFSATGIGGSSLALDPTGNIYMAGSSLGTNYPTTPGAYQTTFPAAFYCFGFCQSGYTGNVQHVTKTDPAASKLIYSTGLNQNPSAGSTTNTGLAVDAAGNAYVTGTLFEGSYPFTVTAPAGANSFLTKLDPAGANVLFSVPVGGAGVQLDSSGAVYVGGAVTSIDPHAPLPGPPQPVDVPPVFSAIPQVCLPNFLTAISEAYVMKIDPAAGAVQDAQWIDGAAPGATGITLAGGRVWITGPTPGPQVPISPGALMPPALGPGFLEGACLSAVDFSAARSGPAIDCVLDSGNLSHVGAVASFQLISIFGSNLGPAAGVAAPDGSDPSIAGVTVSFNGLPAQLLYVSASQINVAVPPPPVLPPANSPAKSAMVMQVTYNGASVERQFPFTASNLNLFADLSTNQNPCPDVPSTAVGFQPVALNADGSPNSCTNPAAAGSTVSLFLHGPGGIGSAPSQLDNLQASFGFGCTALVTNASLVTQFVYKVDVSLPSSLAACDEVFAGRSEGVPLTLSYNDAPVGPLYIPADLAGPVLSFSPPGQPMLMIVWVKQ